MSGVPCFKQIVYSEAKSKPPKLRLRLLYKRIVKTCICFANRWIVITNTESRSQIRTHGHKSGLVITNPDSRSQIRTRGHKSGLVISNPNSWSQIRTHDHKSGLMSTNPGSWSQIRTRGHKSGLVITNTDSKKVRFIPTETDPDFGLWQHLDYKSNLHHKTKESWICQISLTKLFRKFSLFRQNVTKKLHL